MGIRRVWAKLRGVVPISLYPLLAPVYRWDRRRTIRRLEVHDASYREQHPGVLAPSAELRFNVVGACDIPGFIQGGRRTADDIEAALREADASIQGLRKALDFGCGCGRLLLEASQRWQHMKWFGSDVDERSVRWCADNLTDVPVVVNAPLPPLPFHDEEFDLVWCGSVFTHLDEDRQDNWLKEIQRVLAPGGYLLVSIHGPNCWSKLPRGTVARIRDRGFVFARTGGDEGIHPDWYQTAWHTREYVQQHWSRFVDVVAYIPQGFNGYQDVVVCVKRP
jgi:SAM-dependent methyltransferase